MHTAFLIGATGNVGKHLLAELAGDHMSGRMVVRAGARSPEAAAKIAAAGVAAVAFDLDQPDGFDAALQGADVVFLLRPYTIRQLIQGKQVIDAARRVGVRSIVLVGAHGAADTPHPMVGWNMLVEAYAERSGLSWTHLRPNFFMDNLVMQYHAPSGVLYNGISCAVSWISSGDIAAVAAGVLRDPSSHAGRIYGLAVESRSPAEIAGMIAGITGRPCTAAAPPRELVLERLLAQGRELVYAEPLLDYVTAINAGRVPEASEVFMTVQDVAGRAPETLERFLQAALKRDDMKSNDKMARVQV
jgi:uncharacterized protein YbjT (DUF2867 family)